MRMCLSLDRIDLTKRITMRQPEAIIVISDPKASKYTVRSYRTIPLDSYLVSPRDSHGFFKLLVVVHDSPRP